MCIRMLVNIDTVLFEKQDEKFNATHLWNKAAKFDNLWKCQSYWHALKDLENEGVIELDQDKESQTINL